MPAAVAGSVEAECPASVQVGEVTLAVDITAAGADVSLDVTIPQRLAPNGVSSANVMIPQKKNLLQQAAERSMAQVVAVGDAVPESARAVSDCQLLREIARGGMGQIYFGEDPQIKRQVTIEVSSLAEEGERLSIPRSSSSRAALCFAWFHQPQEKRPSATFLTPLH